MDDHTSQPKEAGRRGPIFLFIVAVLACGFFGYQGIARRHRLEWLATVKSLGLSASIMSASKWSSQMLVPGPQQLLDRDIVIVMVDTESQGQALLQAPADCPYDTKIYAFDGLSTKGYLRLEERFPTAVLFTRITE
ncbi:hypothetical protein AYO47_05940 [Planctomyces sp. SCGC AG-212-M04]|nr:hypothetical protein AYO47_05940 [Planctomyces sp. SCGC AG-212-M04]